MPFYYGATNLLTSATLLSVTTESAIYKKENLYCQRPSKPFYFTAKAAQEIVVDLLALGVHVSIIALFNHNMDVTSTMTVEANDLGFPGVALWTQNFAYRQFDCYMLPEVGYRYWKFTFTDASCPENIRIGELYLGEWNSFTKAFVKPGREDGKTFHSSEMQTAYGQDWDLYFSEQKEFKIGITHHEDPRNVDEIETFLSALGGCSGRFVFIPDMRFAHVHYVKVVGSPGATRNFYHYRTTAPVTAFESREWSMTLRELTRGITLL
jgi:hypothetical protein